MTEDKTPVLTRLMEAGYDPCVSMAQCCVNCRHSRTAEYENGETKFVCDVLNISTYKCAWCRNFGYRWTKEED